MPTIVENFILNISICDQVIKDWCNVWNSVSSCRPDCGGNDHLKRVARWSDNDVGQSHPLLSGQPDSIEFSQSQRDYVLQGRYKKNKALRNTLISQNLIQSHTRIPNRCSLTLIIPNRVICHCMLKQYTAFTCSEMANLWSSAKAVSCTEEEKKAFEK